MPNSSRPSAAASDFANGDTPSDPAASRVLVLGAGGFLGRHVSLRLSELGIDHVRVGHRDTGELDGTIDLVSSTQHDVDQVIARAAPTAVINCAGATRGSTAELIQGNVVAVHALLMSLAWSAPTARIVQLGSSAEYGGAPSNTRMAESFPANPSSAYGLTKLAATELVIRSRRQGTDGVVLRIFNVSGPGSPGSTMLGRLIDELSAAPHEPTVTLDSLEGWRDYVDVRDVADAVCRAATIGGPLPPVINVASGQAVQTREWVNDLIAVSRPNVTIIERANPHGTHKASAGAVAWQCADNSLARDRLHWSPRVDLKTSLSDTWTAHQQRLGV
jgi:NDP-hexose 4-ketoreductase